MPSSGYTYIVYIYIFAKTNNLIIANTFGPHKKLRIQTVNSPGGVYHNQIDYILISKHFSTSVNINKTR